MPRTIKLPYEGEADFFPLLADRRRRQGPLVRSAYRRLVAGTSPRDLYKVLRGPPVGQGMHTWLVLSGTKKAAALRARVPAGTMVFGGRRALVARAQGKMDREAWRAARLLPLYIEGHAKIRCASRIWRVRPSRSAGGGSIL